DFSKPMKLNEAQAGSFTLSVNGKTVTFKNYSISNNILQLTLSGSVHFGDTVSISYDSGNVTASDNGPLEAFDDAVSSHVAAPVWSKVPGKIEAEKFTFKSG